MNACAYEEKRRLQIGDVTDSRREFYSANGKSENLPGFRRALLIRLQSIQIALSGPTKASSISRKPHMSTHAAMHKGFTNRFLESVRVWRADRAHFARQDRREYSCGARHIRK
jgi:hypothetical protein